jgi:hypothetical protein
MLFLSSSTLGIAKFIFVVFFIKFVVPFSMDIYLNAGGQFILAGRAGAGPQGRLLHL